MSQRIMLTVVLSWVVAHPKVSVYGNEAKEPCLVVDQLSDRKPGRIGFWVDTGGGEVANLKIK